LERVKTPARGRDCAHVQCFDLEAYLEINQQTEAFNNRWICPMCTLVLRPDSVVIDAYVKNVLESTGEDVERVVLAKDGTWTLSPVEQRNESAAIKKSTDDRMDGQMEFADLASTAEVCDLEPQEALTMLEVASGSGSCCSGDEIETPPSPIQEWGQPEMYQDRAAGATNSAGASSRPPRDPADRNRGGAGAAATTAAPSRERRRRREPTPISVEDGLASTPWQPPSENLTGAQRRAKRKFLNEMCELAVRNCLVHGVRASNLLGCDERLAQPLLRCSCPLGAALMQHSSPTGFPMIGRPEFAEAMTGRSALAAPGMSSWQPGAMAPTMQQQVNPTTGMMAAPPYMLANASAAAPPRRCRSKSTDRAADRRHRPREQAESGQISHSSPVPPLPAVIELDDTI